jgi:hypothetical protein
MAAVSQKISTLIGGVSQQPDTIKYNGQLRSCNNYFPDVAVGLTKRPGLQAIRKLDSPVADGTWFMVFRDDQEKYLMQFSKAGALKIWSANTGLSQTVNPIAAEATDYATHEDNDELQILQINDYIFVLNRNKIVRTDPTLSAAQTPYAFVTINTVAYASTYTVTLDSTDFAYATPTGSTTQLNVKNIVDSLVTAINANVNWVATGIGNNVHIRRANNADFNITARGGNAGTAIEAYKGSVTSPAQLPKQFFNNVKVKVSGSNDTGSDDYWVIFRTDDDAPDGVGVWEETIAPETIINIDEETMPHAIIREANGSFTYRKLDLAGAVGSTGTVVNGIPTAVSALNVVSGGHVVGEQISVTGGTGTGLVLKVTKIKTVTVTNSYIRTSPNYVTRTATSSVATYKWYENNVLIGTTFSPPISFVSSLTVGSKTYTINGSFAFVSGRGNTAGVTISYPVTGVIDTFIIRLSGQDYTASDVVTSVDGDTFTIDTVTSETRVPDTTGLQYWKPREVGDTVTNPMPTFVDNPLDAIAFYRNRLILTSRQNVICSQAGDYFNFFASTVITIVDSDPIDLSASSLRPLRFKAALPSPRGLILFGDNGQYALETTTEAFSPKTAELNQLSNLSATDRIAPIDIGPSYVFLEEGQKASSIFEMDVSSTGAKPTVIELTKLIPTYIPSGVSTIHASTPAGVFAIHSYSDPSSLYLYRWFENPGQGRISSWFKWSVPGTIETFAFDQDVMFIVTKHNSNYILSKMSLVTDTSSQALLFEGEYLDTRLDFFDYNPTLFYDVDTDTTRVCFKEGIENLDEQAVLMYLDTGSSGYFEEQTIQYDATKPLGQQYYLTVEGNQIASSFAIGYKYISSAVLPAFYFVKDPTSANKDTQNIPRLSRIKINSYNSGPFKVIARVAGRPDFESICPQITSNASVANHIPILRNAQSTIPVMARGTDVEIELIADSPFPTAFTSLDWEGTYDNKGIQSL